MKRKARSPYIHTAEAEELFGIEKLEANRERAPSPKRKNASV
jgi:hypothetical protein